VLQTTYTNSPTSIILPSSFSHSSIFLFSFLFPQISQNNLSIKKHNANHIYTSHTYIHHNTLHIRSDMLYEQGQHLRIPRTNKVEQVKYQQITLPKSYSLNFHAITTTSRPPLQREVWQWCARLHHGAHYARAPVAAITLGGKHTQMPVRLHPMCREGHTLALVPAKGDRTPALAAPMPTREGRDPAPAERRIKNTCVKEERRMRTEPEWD
jgi:hypothetical protein